MYLCTCKCNYSSGGNIKFLHADIKSFKKHVPDVTRIHRSCTVLLMLPSPEITHLFPFFNPKRVSQKSQEYVHKGGNDESYHILGNIAFQAHPTSISKALHI